MNKVLAQWRDRPADLSNLLNPAFLGAIIRQSVDGFTAVTSQPMPFELAFIVLPLVLHGDTRITLPARTSTRFHMWIQLHKERSIDFHERARELVPYGRQAIIFAAHRDVLKFSTSGRLSAGESTLRGASALTKRSEDYGDIYKRSEFVGKWLGSAGTSATVFSLMGIRP
jgi:hypothetical protein